MPKKVLSGSIGYCKFRTDQNEMNELNRFTVTETTDLDSIRILVKFQNAAEDVFIGTKNAVFDENNGANIIEYSKTQNDFAIDINKIKGPVPPGGQIRLAGHHWLLKKDIDGHIGDMVVLQWNPGAKKWTHSGNVGTPFYINTEYWEYVSECPIPE